MTTSPSYGAVIVARKPEDVKLRLSCPAEIVTGPMSLNEARNIGASKLKTELIAFIDDDNQVTDETLGSMAEMFVLGIAALSPVILDRRGSIWFEGGRIDSVGRFRKTHGDMTEVFHDCFMVRRSAFEAVGGFDAVAFPFFLGEADLAERMGGLCLVYHHATVVHDIDPRGGILRGSHIRSEPRAYYVARNPIIFVKKYRHLSLYLLFWFPFRTTAHVLGMVRERKYLRSYLRGIWDGLRY